jgi:hypothetical protein
MKLFTVSLVAVAIAACVPAGKKADEGPQRPSPAESEAYMRQAEEQWAMLGITKDRALLPRILAEDYTGMGTRGNLRNKADAAVNQLSDANSKGLVSAKIDAVKYSHFGDVVVAQGSETFKRSGGQPDYHLVWTDVWMWRNGQWQVIASHAAVPVETKPADPLAAAAPAADPLTMAPAQNGLTE